MRIATLVENTIDSAIRKFDPQSRSSYEHWDRELADLENAIQTSDMPADPLLLSSVRAQRIQIASEIGESNIVIELSESFLKEYPATTPSFSNVAALRIDAHHAVGAHEKETRELLRIAKESAFCGSEYVYLLEKLARRHPGRLPADAVLWQKLQEALHQLRDLEYATLPETPDDPTHLEEVACRAADELRRINRERGEALLRNLDET